MMVGKVHEAKGRRTKLAETGSIRDLLLLISTGKFTSFDPAAIKITQHTFKELNKTLSMVCGLCDAPL